MLFKENQKTVSDCIYTNEELEHVQREFDKLQHDYQTAQLTIKNLRGEVEAEKKTSEELRTKREELRNKSTSQGQEER